MLRSLWSKRLFVVGRALPHLPVIDTRPDWEQAEPAFIQRALSASQKRCAGGWYVLDASRALSTVPGAYMVDGRALVVFRSGVQLVAARDVCPHMGAALSTGHVRDGQLLCPWHGRAFGPQPCAGYRPLPTFEDGALAWVRLDDGAESPIARPQLPQRPARGLTSVLRIEAACEPRDVIANRLDPWHGTHFHPHSFARLRLLERSEDSLTVRVAYRVLGPFAVEVDARFRCVDARTIVMTIVRGDGAGSVVETHATPLSPGRTAVIELTVADSDRLGFAVARRLSFLLRPLIARAARRLWGEDAAYAERTFALRRGQAAGGGTELGAIAPPLPEAPSRPRGRV